MLGGVDSKDMVTRMLKHIMTNPLANVYNWHGRGTTGKKGIANLDVVQALKAEYTSVYFLVYIQSGFGLCFCVLPWQFEERFHH